MIDDKKLNQFTLVDVIERKIHFTNTNTIYDKTEFKDINEGELLAYKEMLADVKEMKESEFTNKRELEKMSGYNNAIISILKCVNPFYEYDLEEQLLDNRNR